MDISHKTTIFVASIRECDENDTLHQVTPSTAMAQERVRLCANLFQQQPAEVGFAVANVDYLRLVLSHLQFHLLFQRFEGR